MEPKVTEFLEDLKLMIAAEWWQVPENYKIDFENWCNNNPVGDWSGIEDTGWMTLSRDYLAYLIDKFIQQIENTKEEVMGRMTDGQKNAGSSEQDAG